jgi:hypothetical protein
MYETKPVVANNFFDFYPEDFRNDSLRNERTVPSGSSNDNRFAIIVIRRPPHETVPRIKTVPNPPFGGKTGERDSCGETVPSGDCLRETVPTGADIRRLLPFGREDSKDSPEGGLSSTTFAEG